MATDGLLGIIVLFVALMALLYIFLLLLWRVVAIVFLTALAPLFIAAAVADSNNRFVSWYTDMLIGVALLPLVAAIGMAVTVDIGSTMASLSPMVAVVLFAGGFLFTGRMMRELTKGLFKHGSARELLGGAIGAVVGIGATVATGGLGAGAMLAAGHAVGAGGAVAGAQGMMARGGGAAAAGAAGGLGAGGAAAMVGQAAMGHAKGGGASAPEATMHGQAAGMLFEHLAPQQRDILAHAPNLNPAMSVAHDPQASSLVQQATSHLPSQTPIDGRLSYMAKHGETYRPMLGKMMNAGTYTASVARGAAPQHTPFGFSDNEFERLQGLAANAQRAASRA